MDRKLSLPNIWKSTLDWFLHGDLEVEIVDQLRRANNSYKGRPLADYVGRYEIGDPYLVDGHPGFRAVRSSSGDPRDTLLVRWGDVPVIAGVVDDWGIHLDEAFRGQGLGAELVYAAFSFCGETTADYALYTKAGFAACRSAHRLAVKRALEAGRPVSPAVLADYPELAANRRQAVRR